MALGLLKKIEQQAGIPIRAINDDDDDDDYQFSDEDEKLEEKTYAAAINEAPAPTMAEKNLEQLAAQYIKSGNIESIDERDSEQSSMVTASIVSTPI